MEAPRVHVALDASAAIALLLDEPQADAVEELLRSGSVRMSSVNVAEVIDVLIRRHRGQPDEVIGRVEDLLELAAEAVPATTELSVRAGELRALHFRRDHRLSLADCFVLATAEPGDRIATTDARLAATARAEGYEVVPLG